MGREVRLVPGNWEHPKNEKGYYQPKFNESYKKVLKRWKIRKNKWDKGFRSDYKGGWKKIEDEYKNLSFEEWGDSAPDPLFYMPEFKKWEKTHYMMYETCSEGTPISPAFKTKEELASWLATNNVSYFDKFTLPYCEWLEIINEQLTN